MAAHVCSDVRATLASVGVFKFSTASDGQSLGESHAAHAVTTTLKKHGNVSGDACSQRRALDLIISHIGRFDDGRRHCH
jgi:hypothetical protein